MRDKLIEFFNRYFGIGDSYFYQLTRVKTAFAVGTVDLDDFEELNEETVEDLVEHLFREFPELDKKPAQDSPDEVKLVDANVFIRDLTAMKTAYDAISLDGMIKALQEAPAVNIQSLLPHGKWIHTKVEDYDWGGYFHTWTCSNCGFEETHNPNGIGHCPRCTAIMDEE